MASRLMLVEGEVQRSAEGVVHLMASRIDDYTRLLDRLFAEAVITEASRECPFSRSSGLKPIDN